MSTNKERIENLEASFGDLQTKFDQMEAGVGDKLQQIEASISQISDILITRHETSLGSPNVQAAQSSNGQDRLKGRRSMFTSKLAKLEFPRYSGDDPTYWFTRVGHFSNTKIPQKHIKYLRHPFLWKAMRTNGGNGYVRYIMRKGRLSL